MLGFRQTTRPTARLWQPCVPGRRGSGGAGPLVQTSIHAHAEVPMREFLRDIVRAFRSLRLIVVVAILVGIALLASYRPARRAAAMEPMTTLRVE